MDVRARIGLIIPSSNRLTEPNFNTYAPDGVYPHVTRLRMTGPHHVPVRELLPRIAEAAETLADARCNILVFHCTASSMEAGLTGERAVLDTIQRATGVPATLTASAVLSALHALDARRIALISPYARPAHEHEIEFLAEAGMEVVREQAMELADTDAYLAAPPEFWLDALLGVQHRRADVYFASCTAIRSIDVIEEAETRLGRPVVTSNQAVLWYCLRALGLSDQVPGLGRLMKHDLRALEPV